MDAWETLLNNSSLVSGDAWALLTHPSQSGGGETICPGGEITLDVSDTDIELVTIDGVSLDVVEISVELTLIQDADILSDDDNINIGTCQ